MRDEAGITKSVLHSLKIEVQLTVLLAAPSQDGSLLEHQQDFSLRILYSVLRTQMLYKVNAHRKSNDHLTTVKCILAIQILEALIK